MKTAMQELIEYLDPIHSSIKDKAIQLLEVEKKQIIDAYDLDRIEQIGKTYYNETYD